MRGSYSGPSTLGKKERGRRSSRPVPASLQLARSQYHLHDEKHWLPQEPAYLLTSFCIGRSAVGAITKRIPSVSSPRPTSTRVPILMKMILDDCENVHFFLLILALIATFLPPSLREDRFLGDMYVMFEHARSLDAPRHE